MKKIIYLLVGMTLMLGSCKKGRSSSEISLYFDSIHKAKEEYFSHKITMDSAAIGERLDLLLPTTPILINGVEKRIPFMYTFDIWEQGENRSMQLMVGDLKVIDSELNIRFSHIFSFKEESDMRAGDLFFIRSKDPQAITVNDLLDGIEDRVLYFDNECVIYQIGENIYAQFFKYFASEGIYAVFYTDTFFKLRGEFLPVKLDFIIDDLRVIKTFFSQNKLTSFKTWNEYTRVFSPGMLLIVEKQRQYLSKVLSDIADEDVVINGEQYISLPLDKDINKVWDRLNKQALNKEFVLDNDTYKFDFKDINYWYNGQKTISVFYKDKNTIILKCNTLNGSTYSYIKKIVLRGKEFLIVDYKLIESPNFWENEPMLMYRLRMLESLTDVKQQ
ncbi:hypothetical protein MYRA21_1441 [Myroides sp. A21]|uniref:hypothetical protein n=1 Tax=Myroides sp. A21 TaxID=1583100 RepID=UPI00057DD302|nr:hypothetical protein [Myroides sp. A21]AJA68599.1 hypothetical protein MYRA21_1441 [Myroides sp. A21]